MPSKNKSFSSVSFFSFFPQEETKFPYAYGPTVPAESSEQRVPGEGSTLEPEHEAIQQVKERYQDLFKLASTLKGASKWCSPKEIAALPVINSPAIRRPKGQLRALTKQDLQGHIAVRGVSDTGEPFIGFILRNIVYTLSLQPVIPNVANAWISCIRTPGDTREFFSVKDRYAVEVVSQHASNITNLNYVLQSLIKKSLLVEIKDFMGNISQQDRKDIQVYLSDLVSARERLQKTVQLDNLEKVIDKADYALIIATAYLRKSITERILAASRPRPSVFPEPPVYDRSPAPVIIHIQPAVAPDSSQGKKSKFRFRFNKPNVTSALSEEKKNRFRFSLKLKRR